MSKYTPEQVERACIPLQRTPEYGKYGAHISIQQSVAHYILEMLRDYATLLRERESAKAVVTDELAERVLNRYVNECISHLDEAPVHLRVTAMRVALEAVAPMLAKTKSDPVAWRYRLDGDMQWQHTSDKRICMGEIEPLYAVAPMLASARVPDGMIERIDAAIQRIDDGHAPRRIPADPTDVDLVLAEVRAYLKSEKPPFWIATAPKPETEE